LSSPEPVVYQIPVFCQVYVTLPVAVRNRCSRVHIGRPGISGNATSSPAWSPDSAIRPGPWASTMMSGRPDSIRFHPPAREVFDSRIPGSSHRTAWCEK